MVVIFAGPIDRFGNFPLRLEFSEQNYFEVSLETGCDVSIKRKGSYFHIPQMLLMIENHGLGHDRAQ